MTSRRTAADLPRERDIREWWADSADALPVVGRDEFFRRPEPRLVEQREEIVDEPAPVVDEPTEEMPPPPTEAQALLARLEEIPRRELFIPSDFFPKPCSVSRAVAILDETTLAEFDALPSNLQTAVYDLRMAWHRRDEVA